MTFFNIATGQTLRECDFYALVSGTVYDCCNQSQNVWIAQPNNLAFNEYQWQQYFISNPPACGYTLTLTYSSSMAGISLEDWNYAVGTGNGTGNFTNVSYSGGGTIVTLTGGSNVLLNMNNGYNVNLVEISDNGAVTSLYIGGLAGITTLTSVILNGAVIVAPTGLGGCTSLTHIELPACTDLGGTTGDDLVFDSITGNTITAVFNSVLATCNAGDKDGDILYLGANNTCSITYV